MTHLDFSKSFYERFHTRDSIVAEVDSVLGSRPREIKATAIPFSTARTPRADFVGQISKTRTAKLLKESDGIHLFELTYIYREGRHKRSELGKFYVYEHPAYPNVFVAISIEGGSFVRRGLLPFLRSRFPHIVVGFLPQARLNRLLAEFRASYGYSELIVTRATQRLRLPEEGTHRRVMPITSWPDMALDEAIDWLVEHNGWFQSIQFEARRDGRTTTKVSVTREGVVKCDYLFEQVWAGFVLPLCKMHHANFNLFSKRGRRENPELAARPLAVKFEDERFADVEENNKFIQAMRSLSTASVSVLHGNPYIHLGVIDYMDGSTFDLWVLDSQELIIVPQMHGSVGSIKRLVNHVFDTYAEGEVSDYMVGAR